jgi:plasmid stabilization system protein ParE
MVVNKHLPIIWDKEAKAQLRNAYNEILKESYQGAVTVRDGILDTVDKITEQPYRYPADKFKTNNTGNYRAFELHNYRVAYRVTDEDIRILRVRHVKREPLEY